MSKNMAMRIILSLHFFCYVSDMFEMHLIDKAVNLYLLSFISLFFYLFIILLQINIIILW